jgi:hypothetical protein
MGKDSGRLTRAQMKEYIELDSNFTDKTEDTLTTGDIYHYVVEGNDKIIPASYQGISTQHCILRDCGSEFNNHFGGSASST